MSNLFDDLKLKTDSTDEEIHQALELAFKPQKYPVTCSGCGNELPYKTTNPKGLVVPPNNCPDCAQKEFAKEKKKKWFFGF